VTTGVPIYLVSACASGEEFVAAFRRYADKNGLFIPIASPIPAGRKGRFAVTLKDGGVMIEGDAEIISSATTPSVLHGRVGMTLRFADLDIKSKTVLVELEQARLAMKPQPPSVPPRPAAVPAEPRAKVPTIAGRIDTNNALAECVAIGDVDGLEVNAAAQLAKPGAKFVVPSIPPVGAAARPKSPSTPPMPYIAKPTKQGVEPPPRTGVPPVIPPPISMTATSPGVAVAKPRPAVDSPTPQGMTSVAPPPVKPAVTPMSITTVDAPPVKPAVTPMSITTVDAPPITPDRAKPAVTPMSITTVDAPLSITPSSMPTVEPPLVTPTSMGAKELAVPRTFSEEVTQFPQVRSAEVFQAVDDAVPEPLPSTGSKPTGSGRTNLPPPRRSTGTTQPPRMATPATPLPAVGSKVSKPTQIGMPIVDLKPPAPPSVPLPPVVAEAKPAAPELAADEPTDIGGPPVIVEEVPVPQVEDVVPGGLRRTMIGPAVVPDGVTVLPAAQTPAKTDEDDEKRDTALMDAIPRVTGQPAPDPHGETAVAAKVQAALAARPPVIEEPSGDWTMTPGADGPTIIPRTPETKPRTPTGDWTIARDDGAPDGWGEPSKPDAKAYEPPKPEPKPVRAKNPASPRNPASAKDVRVNTGPPVAVVSGEKPLESTMSAKAFDIEEETKAGLKIEIDATLAAEVDSRIAEEAGLASTQFATVQAPLTPPPGTLQPVAMPPQQMPMQSMSTMPAHSMSMALQQPTPIPRPMPPYGDYPQASRQSGAANLFGGVGDSTSLVEINRRKRLIVILASAGLAVVIGTVLYLALRKSDEKPTAETKHEVQPPPAVDAAAMIATPVVIDAAAVEEPPVTPDAAVEQASVKPQRDCMIEVDSSPSGADIVRGDQVIGTTPTHIALPCGVATKLVFRKAKLSSVAKTVTATDNGRVRVAFAKAMLSVKVTSSPPGATITVGGKSLGVTPAMVKLPANESATLVISKPGFTNDSQKFTPKQNNQSVHFSLKKKAR
jgi:hypothetical protein